MKVCVVGWYGTETIGDRAIIAGIYSFLLNTFNNVEIKLGALYPFYSERMISEDQEVYRKIFKRNIDIELFDSRKKNELDKNIRKCDMVIVGGGPLMHIDELYMIEYALKKAKKLNKKTGIIGCGIGPIFPKEFKKSVLNIVENSDIIILRDESSKLNLITIANELSYKLDIEKVKVSYDPAVEFAILYMENKCCIKDENKEKEIVINLRDFPEEYCKDNKKRSVNSVLEKFIIDIANRFNNKIIRLVPMHYFYIGNDDREFLNSIAIKNNLKNVKVQNKILTLKETLDLFANAEINVGMRFHSVVLQTIVNGKNFVLDYTEPNKGKISGFLKDIDDKEFYSGRYVSLQKQNSISLEMFDKENMDKKFSYNLSKIKNRLQIYSNELAKIK